MFLATQDIATAGWAFQCAFRTTCFSVTFIRHFYRNNIRTFNRPTKGSLETTTGPIIYYY